MKKVIFLLILLLSPLLLMAQDPEVPADLSTLLSNLSHFVGSLAGLAGVVIFIAAILNTVLKIIKKWLKLLVALGVAIVLALLTNLLNFGLFSESTWLETVFWGVGLGVVAGGIFDIPTMKVIVDLILSIIKLKKPI